MIPKIEDYKIYLKEALNSEYYEDLKYLEKEFLKWKKYQKMN